MRAQIDELFSKIFKGPFFWAKDSLIRTLILFTGIYIFLFPIAEWMQGVIRNLPIQELFISSYSAIVNNLTPVEYILFCLILITLIFVGYLIYEIRRNKIVVDNFKNGLNLWSIPFNSGWSTERCTDANGNMLTVEGYSNAGILKATHNWYDYHFSFYTKIPESGSRRMMFVVRADNSSNGVAFELTKNSLTPYLLNGGRLILDEHNKNDLSLILNEGTWIKISVDVIGNDVEILAGEGNKIHYKLPTLTATVEETTLNQLGSSLTLQHIRESDQKWHSSIKRAIDLNSEVNKETNPQIKKEKMDQAEAAWNAIPKNTTQISLEYSKGTVGFMGTGQSKFCIRNVSVKRI